MLLALAKPSIKSKLLWATAWGVGYHGLALFWITGVHPMTWMGVPWLSSLLIAIACWLFITFWGAALVALWSAGMMLLSASSRQKFLPSLSRVLFGVACWCVLEAIWSAGPLWWSSLSYTQSPYNLAILQLGKLSGPTTVTAALVAVNGLIAEGIIAIRSSRQQKPVLLVLPLIVFLGLHLIGWGMYARPLADPQAAALKVGIIQGNIPNVIKLSAPGLRRALTGYTRGYQQLVEAGVEAVLTPEGALPFFQDKLMNSTLVQAIREQGVVAWVGTFGHHQRGYTNSLFTMTEDGIFSRYDKVNLVPVGEYVPFESVLGGIIERLSPLDEHQIAGSPDQVLATPFGRAIVGICYDSTYARHFRRQAAQGGELILTASNNAHYSSTMPAQHHAQDVMRAIETDRWAARATNTGYSGVVDPHGRTVWISDINTYEVYAGTIYRRQTQTLYVRWGDWLTIVLAVLAAITSCYSRS